MILLVLILGLPGVLIVITAHRVIYVLWMLVYLLSLPVWNFILPTYAFWHFDDFSWGDTRQTAGAVAGADKGGHDEDGEFDSSKNSSPFDFRLGAGEVIEGWDKGVAGMKVGGTRVLTIPPAMGYGSRGAGGVIPPNATLLFEVELLDVK